MVGQTEGAQYAHRIFAHFMHIRARHMHAPQFYCQTFDSEPASVSRSPPPLINHGWRTAAIRWDPENGPKYAFDGTCQETIWELSLRSDLLKISGPFPTKI